jgi:hypothetical protein
MGKEPRLLDRVLAAIRTTQIYTHVTLQGALGVVSPLKALSSA